MESPTRGYDDGADTGILEIVQTYDFCQAIVYTNYAYFPCFNKIPMQDGEIAINISKGRFVGHLPHATCLEI